MAFLQVGRTIFTDLLSQLVVKDNLYITLLLIKSTAQ